MCLESSPQGQKSLSNCSENLAVAVMYDFGWACEALIYGTEFCAPGNNHTVSIFDSSVWNDRSQVENRVNIHVQVWPFPGSDL